MAKPRAMVLRAARAEDTDAAVRMYEKLGMGPVMYHMFKRL